MQIRGCLFCGQEQQTPQIPAPQPCRARPKRTPLGAPKATAALPRETASDAGGSMKPPPPQPAHCTASPCCPFCMVTMNGWPRLPEGMAAWRLPSGRPSATRVMTRWPRPLATCCRGDPAEGDLSTSSERPVGVQDKPFSSVFPAPSRGESERGAELQRPSFPPTGGPVGAFPLNSTAFNIRPAGAGPSHLALGSESQPGKAAERRA